jgi:hypothetical protein
VQIPADTREFAINMSNMRHWAAPVKRYIDECLAGKEGPRGKDFNMRWVASMVADVHRILTRGGVFLYPWDRREPDKPGKLRLMYEANPMAFLVEQAGGQATNGTQRIMDLVPTKDINPSALHESRRLGDYFAERGMRFDAVITGTLKRVSVMLGSKNEVQRGGMDGVQNAGRDDADRRLADAAPEVEARHNHGIDLRHVGHRRGVAAMAHELRDAAEHAGGQRLAPAGVLGRGIQHRQVLGMLAHQLAAEGHRIGTRGAHHLLVEALQVGTV